MAARNALSATMVNYLGARMNLFLEIGILRADQGKFWIMKKRLLSTSKQVNASSLLLNPKQAQCSLKHYHS